MISTHPYSLTWWTKRNVCVCVFRACRIFKRLIHHFHAAAFLFDIRATNIHHRFQQQKNKWKKNSARILTRERLIYSHWTCHMFRFSLFLSHFGKMLVKCEHLFYYNLEINKFYLIIVILHNHLLKEEKKKHWAFIRVWKIQMKSSNNWIYGFFYCKNLHDFWRQHKIKKTNKSRCSKQKFNDSNESNEILFFLLYIQFIYLFLLNNLTLPLFERIERIVILSSFYNEIKTEIHK